MRAGLGVAVVAVLLWHFDARPIFRILSRERPAYFAAAVALYLAGQALSAYRWQILSALLKVHGRYCEFLAYTFVCMFTNLFVPGLLGGDAARSVYLGRRHGRMGEAIASVVADRGVGLISLFWLAAIAAMFLNFAPLPRSVITPTVVVGAIAMAGFLASPLVARLIHLMPRSVRRAGGLVAPYLHNPAALIPAIALSIVLQIDLAVCQYILAAGLGLAMPLSLVYPLRSDCERVCESAADVEWVGDSRVGLPGAVRDGRDAKRGRDRAGAVVVCGDDGGRSDGCDRIRDDARARGVAIERRGVRAG